MLCFILLSLFGYSAYASQLLICVTMKEIKSNAKCVEKSVVKGGIEPPKIGC